MRLANRENNGKVKPASQERSSMAWRASLVTGMVALAGGLMWPTAAIAKDCPKTWQELMYQPLQQPHEIHAQNGVLDTTLVVRFKTHECILGWDTKLNGGKGGLTVEPTMELRTYGYPIDPSKNVDPENLNDPNLKWTFPGPTYRVRKTYLKDPNHKPGANNPIVKQGDRINVALHNRLTPNLYWYDKCNQATVTTVTKDGKKVKVAQTSPECFHGNNVTNIHYHGTHVSPQPHQDYVLLQLFPKGQLFLPSPVPVDNMAVGDYQTSIDPLPWNQAEGTHWYHPHKHGSTALQVLNGMAGALIIEGPFDDWLYGYYGVNSKDKKDRQKFEKVLVVQEIGPDVNFPIFDSKFKPDVPLINGQLNPVITMRPGEMQRWRFIGATMRAAAQIEVLFTGIPGLTVKQIAMDGVQFAPENYARQPLLATESFQLSPGNRADFLVQAPSVPGRYALTHQKFALLPQKVTQLIEKQRQLLIEATGGDEHPLLTIEVTGDPVTMDFPKTPKDDPACKKTPKPNTCWPDMPQFLSDITQAEVKGPKRTVAFSMTDPKTGKSTTPGQPSNGFWIDRTQYMAECANKTMMLNTAEEWNVTNDSNPNHPFHIHINPFQVIQKVTLQKGATEKVVGTNIQTFQPPYIWQDTIALPSGNARNEGSVTIRHRFLDYTGGYVIHCHILGHEDRGMMQNVQTVCPTTGKFGTTVLSGQPDNCSKAVDILPTCPESPYAMAQ